MHYVDSTLLELRGQYHFLCLLLFLVRGCRLTHQEEPLIVHWLLQPQRRVDKSAADLTTVA